MTATTPPDRPDPTRPSLREEGGIPWWVVAAAVALAAVAFVVALIIPDGDTAPGPSAGEQATMTDREWCEAVIWEGGLGPTGWTEAEVVDDCLDALPVFSRSVLIDTYRSMLDNENG